MNETPSSLPVAPVRSIAVVGAGRLGGVLARALRDAGFTVIGPLHRDDAMPAVDIAILCVPDAAIRGAADAPRSYAGLVGHVSGATGLDDVDFSVHPLQTFTGSESADVFHGIGAAIGGRTPEALETARRLAEALGAHPFPVDDAHRAGYHASASIASNLLLAVLDAAEQVAGSAGIPAAEARAVLAPLVRQTVENWAERGAAAALTGPVARGDEGTVARQRVAIGARNPELLGFVDGLIAQTRVLAGHAGDRVSSRSARSTTPGGRSLDDPGGRSLDDPGVGEPDDRYREDLRMRIIRTIAEVRGAVRDARRQGKSIGLVPTMGAFHAGHLSLMDEARKDTDLVVVSLFVNPTQFGPNEDLSRYPRDEQRDAELAEKEGVDILFAPEPTEIYPDGFATSIHVSGITDVLDGASRGAHHFDGVATVVAKLFGIVAPDIAYFGQKDAQQVLVVRRLVRDLNIDVRIQAVPTVREPDGLAMSSRNVYLDPAARQQATALNRALEAASDAAGRGERDAAALVGAARRILDDAGIAPEYLELRDAETLREIARLDADGLLAVAAHVGAARLIDNRLLRVSA